MNKDPRAGDSRFASCEMRSRSKGRSRRGVAAVELAVCLPVIMLLVLASVEACTMLFVQQSLETTAYETARIAASPRSAQSDALDRGSQVIQDRDLQGATITIAPSSPDRGDDVTATVTAPFDSNRMFPSFFFGNQQLTANVTMQKE